MVDGSLDLELLNAELKDCRNSIGTISSNIRELQSQVKPLEEKLERIGEFYKEYDLDELKAKDNEWRVLERDIALIKQTISKYQIELSHTKKHLDGIGSFTYDDNCEHCVKNKNTPFAKQSLELETKIITLTKKISVLETELSEKVQTQKECDVKMELDKVNQVKEKEQEVNRKYYNLLSELNDSKSDYNQYESQYEKISANIEKAKKQEKSVEFNAKLNEEINSLKQKRLEIQSELNRVTTDLIDLLGELRVQKNTIESVNESIEKLNQMELKYNGYEHYLSAVKRDGIPYGLIAEILPKLEIEINNILQPIVDFQIILDTDGKNINSYICYGDDKYWPLELTSGMEKFVSSIAIRTALISISNLPRPNFIAIDEGFGSLDTDNFNSLYLLFDYLKTQFDFIITISHIDKTRDMVDQIIDINKINSFSSIKYL